jgi:hypothetical protein
MPTGRRSKRLDGDGTSAATSVAYHQTSHEDSVSRMAARGASEQTIRDMTEMHDAQNEGLYEGDWAAATPTATDFRTWFADVLPPAADA